ncbi:hypothetical protein VM98_17825 [Streptomyces rubellomurinus subsp. indigoferus]|uniref:LigA protein n=1 Tax=Streptomyces rubellomurinus (strain ATCC 31215) TaxID=359131 RepID=A0A0F2T9T5_STRR3|nr:hypothetical protein [Streptomyces rubellomurinus]KJS54656.1 hypothetical protein VM98_17825 [Streptomyces rubellomurinus subsp. indigoferus]KJS59075.1 hypothetical protein VM95_29435 [Streptomyces rubellomurinus]
MSENDKFEDDLLVAMTRTGEGFRTEQGELVAGGYQRGRRRWRRRSTAAVVGGAAALALVGGGAVYLTGSPAKDAAPVAAAAAPSGSAGLTPAASPSAASASEAPAAPPVSGDDVVAAFKALLPAGQTFDAKGTGTEPPAGKPYGGGISATASLVFDDGHGKAAMGISLGRLGDNDPNRSQNTCPDKKLVPYDACTATTLPDGSTLTVFQGYEYPDKHVSTKWWNAKLIGKDGRQIELSEWNSAAEKDAADSRTAPPLSPEQLKAIVTDKSWDKVVASIPEPKPVRTRDTGKEYSAQEILQITAKLLPSGLRETEVNDKGDGYANFVLDDGKGKSLVEVNVQDWGHNEVTKEQVFGNAETKPDGSKVVVRKQPGNPAGWIVDALHPDGTRVVVAAYNSGSQRTPATRTTPVLTDEQLQTIALSPEWKLKK